MTDSPATGYRGALRHRDFRVLMARYVTSGIGSWAYVVALVAFVYEQTGSATWVAAVSIARLAPMFFFSIYAGVLAERFERTRLMLVSDLSALVCMLGLVAVVLLEAPIWVAIAFSAITAVATIMEEPAVAALVPQIVGEDDLAAANGLFGIIANLNVIAGPAVGAVLLALTSAAGTFAVNAGTFAVAAALVAILGVRSTPTDVTGGGETGLLGQLTVGVRAIGEHRVAVILVAFGTLASFLWGVDTVLFPVLGDALGLGPNGFGYLLTGLGIGGVVAGTLVSRLSKQPRLAATIAASMVIFSIPTALLVVVDDPVVAFGLQVVRGGAVLVVEVLAITALQRTLPPDLISRVFGAVVALDVAAMVAGAAIAPILLANLGLDGTMSVLGIGIPVLVAATMPWWRRTDHEAVARLAELAPRVRMLEAMGIFTQASPAVLERLAAAATDVDLPAGTVIIHEGDPADALYVLAAGQVAVTSGQGGSSRALATLAAPGFFGEIGLLQRIPRTATVTALSDVTLQRIDGASFLDALTTTPASPAFVESARLRLAGTIPAVTDERTGATVEQDPSGGSRPTSDPVA
jgi:predicted MFS family arabinose efflux permease